MKGVRWGNNVEKEMLTAREAARYLNLNEKIIYRLVKEGRLPGARITGKWTFSRSQLRGWIESHSLEGIGSFPFRSESKAATALLIAGSDDLLLGRVLAQILHAECPELMTFYATMGSTEGIRAIREAVAEYETYVSELMASDESPVHPLRFVKELSDAVPEDHTLIVDVGVSAIYTSTFYKVRSAGRSILFNYAMGALGYAIPASVGVLCARPGSCVVTLVGDGSFGFTAAELETVRRVGGNNNIVLFNNLGFGWIKAEAGLSHGMEYADFSTNFGEVDYIKVAEGFGLTARRVEGPGDLGPALREAFDLNEPTFTELRVQPENELVPPVPAWKKKAEGLGIRHIR